MSAWSGGTSGTVGQCSSWDFCSIGMVFYIGFPEILLILVGCYGGSGEGKAKCWQLWHVLLAVFGAVGGRMTWLHPSLVLDMFQMLGLLKNEAVGWEMKHLGSTKPGCWFWKGPFLLCINVCCVVKESSLVSHFLRLQLISQCLGRRWAAWSRKLVEPSFKFMLSVRSC